MITIKADLKYVVNGEANVAVKCSHDHDDKELNSFEIVAILRALRDSFADAFMVAMSKFIEEEIADNE